MGSLALSIRVDGLAPLLHGLLQLLRRDFADGGVGCCRVHKCSLDFGSAHHSLTVEEVIGIEDEGGVLRETTVSTSEVMLNERQLGDAGAARIVISSTPDRQSMQRKDAVSMTAITKEKGKQ